MKGVLNVHNRNSSTGGKIMRKKSLVIGEIQKMKKEKI